MKGSKFGRYKKVYFKFKNYLSILIFSHFEGIPMRAVEFIDSLYDFRRAFA